MKELTQEQKDERIRELHSDALKLWPQIEKIIDELKLLGPHSLDSNNALLNSAEWLEQLADRASLGLSQKQVAQAYPALEQKVIAFVRSKNMKVGDVITVGNSFRLNFFQSLNPLEQSQLEACLQSMHDNGLLTENLAITEAGVTAIYA